MESPKRVINPVYVGPHQQPKEKMKPVTTTGLLNSASDQPRTLTNRAQSSGNISQLARTASTRSITQPPSEHQVQHSSNNNRPVPKRQDSVLSMRSTSTTNTAATSKGTSLFQKVRDHRKEKALSKKTSVLQDERKRGSVVDRDPRAHKLVLEAIAEHIQSKLGQEEQSKDALLLIDKYNFSLELLDPAETEMQKENYALAREILSYIPSVHDSSAKARFLLLQLDYYEGKFDTDELKNIALALKTLEVEPAFTNNDLRDEKSARLKESAQLLHLCLSLKLGKILFNMKQYDHALNVLVKIPRRSCHDLYIFLMRGRCYVEQNKFQEALEEFMALPFTLCHYAAQFKELRDLLENTDLRKLDAFTSTLLKTHCLIQSAGVRQDHEGQLKHTIQDAQLDYESAYRILFDSMEQRKPSHTDPLETHAYQLMHFARTNMGSAAEQRHIDRINKDKAPEYQKAYEAYCRLEKENQLRRLQELGHDINMQDLEDLMAESSSSDSE